VIDLRLTNAQGRLLQEALSEWNNVSARKLLAEVVHQIRYFNFGNENDDNPDEEAEKNLAFFEGETAELSEDEAVEMKKVMAAYERDRAVTCDWCRETLTLHDGRVELTPDPRRKTFSFCDAECRDAWVKHNPNIVNAR
jgi:hypothetical protein